MLNTTRLRTLIYLGMIALLGGCTSLFVLDLESLYGPANPQPREVTQVPAGDIDYWSQARPIFEKRCSVCHGCFDAPCQLQTTSIEGIVRGISQQEVYHQSRLKPASLSRLFEDSRSLQSWREKEFYPVLNEHVNELQANRDASLIYKVLELKEQHPLPDDKLLPTQFDLSLSRKNICPRVEEFSHYSNSKPLAGMPYGLPGLKLDEQSILMRWVEQGGNYTPRTSIAKKYQAQIERWEHYFNGKSDRKKLISRYQYEHLFIAHLYFDELTEDEQQPVYFKLVRSITPPGEPIDLIASRRPYDDPGVSQFYYRLQRERAGIIAKTHMPYALNEKRLSRWKSLFDEVAFDVDTLPDYELETSANPFLIFRQIPVKSRYQFMLDEAQFTIMGFIKGPVCRGQVALNVINDKFWVFFFDPNAPNHTKVAEFLQNNVNELDLPAGKSSALRRPGKAWRHYASLQKTLLQNKSTYLRDNISSDNPVRLSGLWAGDGNNPNSALTVFRHFDSATVEKGLVGIPPKTAWVIGYSLLERIHYLLVAGYDVYGNAGHQLVTRIYMDFLRMEGESNFLAFLPKEARDRERLFWYRDAKPELQQFVQLPIYENSLPSTIEFRSNNPKLELFQLLADHLDTGVPTPSIKEPSLNRILKPYLTKINALSATAVAQLPETSIVQIEGEKQRYYFTLVRHNALSSVTSLFKENKKRLHKEDTVEIIPGVIGTYPNAFHRIKLNELAEYSRSLSELNNSESYSRFVDHFGVRRTDPEFWTFSDQLHEDYRIMDRVKYGLLDYSRLENR